MYMDPTKPYVKKELFVWNEDLPLKCVFNWEEGKQIGKFDISQQKSNLKANDGKARCIQ